MKQSLQLRMGQQLSMTPQLQQAIKLLQLSTLDLQQEIQQVLDSNMMIEVTEEEGSSLSEQKVVENKVDTTDRMSSEGSQTDIPDELPTDSSWEDVFDSVQMGSGSTPANDAPDFEAQRTKVISLQDHLLWQMEMLPFTNRDRAMAMAIVDSVNKEGYLTNPGAYIYQGLSEQIEDLEEDEFYAVLHRVQQFDPPGVAAEDLKDCLHIQLRQLPEDTPFRAEAIELVKRHLELLAAQEIAKLVKRLAISEHKLGETIALIRSLDPVPGQAIEEGKSEYVIPDLFVAKVSGQWQVELNPDIAPRLRVNPFYSSMIKRTDNSKDNVSMKEHLQEARWFIKSLHSRNDTLLRVGRSIIRRQTEFLEHGAIAMKPMILRDIAEELELHESTISRVTTQKYMHLPNGVIEFKHFFSSHVSTAEGGECSATAIRAFIKELVNNENPVKPLSDSKMAGLLKEKGINVARRTIAKYREAISIPASRQRKRLL
ncbi:MAG: RNA polymerase factor sigma-54 [Gammaproteobacteria bacterium]|jgi:RNA polymerase sigma-54 factor|nr:RNA polymerase factor sigma-54 [Gammaproteobacteria bacterium]MBT5221882.1 RNA polymerase factor sigma-54 [Gammaproteobacteria bacterium]MBT5824908.1 RNA polymerase factor sigma-54 [Gammaproteobacteria bacterium]MBT5967316.1 RNA polymerase factor sigma-54 [Gammaproteobacteria bacterium]MBT6419083.1 RNA polymerase factor sigma-54 [Gammaproteobacteria bacterium]